MNASTQAAPTNGSSLRFSLEPQPVSVSVQGVVRDKRSGNPIPNAPVRAHITLMKFLGPESFEKSPRQETVADASGHYQITFTTPLTTTGPLQGRDNLCVYASAPGYETLPQYGWPSVTAAKLSYELNFDLQAGKKVSGRVVDAAGQPVSGASVRVQNGLNGDWNYFGALGATRTAEDGSFQLWIGAADSENLGRNPWLCIVKPGAGTLFVWNLFAKEDLGTLTLNSGGELIGQVVDPGGKPVPDCEVSARLWPCDLVCQTRTDAQGQYRLAGLPGDPSMGQFFKQKNGRYDPALGQVEVYARLNAETPLTQAPHYKIAAKEGQALTSSNLVLGADASVAGTLLPSKTALSLGGLLVRLDDKWEDLVEAGMNGQFRFPYVAPGKHTLTAYLPHNLRYDRGIGKAQIEVQAGIPLQNVQIQLLDLAELRVQYLDAKGNPLPGISAAATWSKNGDGAWTEGTVADADGWAVLYLYPDSVQYVRGFDPAQRLTAETPKEINPQPAQVLAPLRIVLVPTATVKARLMDEQGQPVGAKLVLGTLNLADGSASVQRFKTEADGSFRWRQITPGIMRLSLELNGVAYQDPLGKAVEVRPGQTEDLGTIVLTNGLDKAKVIREKQAHALEQPQEVTQAAQELFARIRQADYDYFLKPGADWQRFPIVGSYQTHQWFDTLVTWMSTTFKTNPIVTVELGQVFANPKAFNRQTGLPTVPYKLTLQNGRVLEGNLPFEYNFDGAKGHWHGLEGIDWHLQKTQL
ncbi:MAG TPA: carboxypeptidase-like regulatory domain-containing protein [Candidatus Sulfotelmatobacter sp.]|nr:carboxypeptidase-like regulatory domain-containing protein [Candidatus Sulfotelmatobacter sp.]